MKLTDEQKQEYLNGGGSRCPYCGDNDIVGSGFDFDAAEVWQTIYCEGCSKKWRDIYRLVEIEEMK